MTDIPIDISYRNWTPAIHAKAFLEVNRLRETLRAAEDKLDQAETAALDKYDSPFTSSGARSPLTVITHKSAEDGTPSKALVIRPPASGHGPGGWTYVVSEVVG